MLILFAALTLSFAPIGGQDEEIVRRRPMAPAASNEPSNGQLAAPSTKPVTALTELNCMFGGQAVPCPEATTVEVEPPAPATAGDDLWALFEEAAGSPIVDEPTYSRSRCDFGGRPVAAEGCPPATGRVFVSDQPSETHEDEAPAERGCRREEYRSADGTSASFQVVCGNGSEAQRAVSEMLNRPD